MYYFTWEEITFGFTVCFRHQSAATIYGDISINIYRTVATVPNSRRVKERTNNAQLCSNNAFGLS